MSNEIAQYKSEDVPAIADDYLIQVAAQAEARIDAVIKIKKCALKVTNGGDWVDQNGKPYLMASGAEKIANLFNISWVFLTPEPTCDVDPDGHYTYTYQAKFSLGSRTIDIEGSRSSRDGFFSQYAGSGDSRKAKDVSDRDNKRDVKMAAYTNLLGNGITRILGIRNMTYADLEEFAGIKKESMGKVEYKTKPPISQPQEKQQTSQQSTSQGAAGPVISEAQSKRFYAISKGKEWTDEQVKELLQKYGLASSKEIPKAKYEELCGLIEKGPEALTQAGDKPSDCNGDPASCQHSEEDEGQWYCVPQGHIKCA